MMKHFWAFLALFLACSVGLHAKVYVVSVGIADYPNKKNDLRISDNDAKTVANIFGTTKNAVTQVITNQEATQAALLNSMHTLFSKANSEDAVILYFSGHGAPGALVCYDGLLAYQHIYKLMRSCKANRKIIIADACYSGKMRTNNKRSTSYNAQNVMLFLSSRTNELSQETKFKNSLFTIFLDRGLRGGADTNKDRRITAQEIFRFVHQGVVSASDNRQHPVMWGKFNNDMTIIKW